MFGDINIVIIIELSNSLAFFITLFEYLRNLNKIIGINRTYLSNYINNTYGLNFNLWINHLRIEEAKQLMGQTPKRSLSEIAERIGFTDLAHFSKQFKLQEGVSPSEWRKNM